MEIAQYDPSMVDDVTALYNDVVRGVPHCWPVAADDMAKALASDPATSPESTLDDETVVVAIDGGEVHAFAHAGMQLPEDPYRQSIGVVRFLAFRRNDHRAGQAVLAEAESHIGARSIAPSLAFDQAYRYPFFCFGAAYLSDELDHIGSALGLAGYSRVCGEVFLDWPDFAPAPTASTLPVAGAELRVMEVPGGGALPGLQVQCARCWHVSAGDFSRADEAQEWAFCTSLHVRREFQRNGIGKWLLRTALGYVKERGYRHASISTASENWRAQSLYGNMGYRSVDWTYGWQRPGHKF